MVFIFLAHKCINTALPHKITMSIPPNTQPNNNQVSNPAIDQMDAAAKQQQQNNEIIKLNAGETLVFHIDPSPAANKISTVQEDYKGDKKFRTIGVYKVFDVNAGRERTLKLSMKWATELNALLKAGWTAFTITREGSSREDTKYRFIPLKG